MVANIHVYDGANNTAIQKINTFVQLKLLDIDWQNQNTKSFFKYGKDSKNIWDNER